MSHVSASFSATIRVRPGGRTGRVRPARAARSARPAARSARSTSSASRRASRSATSRSTRPTPSTSSGSSSAFARVEGIEVEHVSDRTFLHAPRRQDRDAVEGAGQDARRPLDGLHARRRARSARRSPSDRDAAWNLTIKQNTVAVVSDGTAVLGLGDIGPEAAMPVMEGKALLFKEFGGVDAWPLCLDTKDLGRDRRVVKAIAPGFGGINLEDISAPRCFEIEERLRAELDIPVFHDDQHGTAIVVLAALLNALTRRRQAHRGHHVVTTGVGAAGVAVTDILLNAGVRTSIGCDRDGRDLRRARRAQSGQAVVRRAHEPRLPAGHRGRGPRRRRRLPRPLGARRGLTAGHRADGRRRDRVRDGQPDARDRARGPAARQASPSWRPDAPTTRTRSTTCSRSPASSVAPSTSGRARSRRAMKVAAGHAIASVIADDELGPEYMSRASSTATSRSRSPRQSPKPPRQTASPGARAAGSRRRAAGPRLKPLPLPTRNAALRAGRASRRGAPGRSPPATPTMIAAIANTITWVVGNEKSIRSIL